MNEKQIAAGYILTDNSNIYVQIPADNQWGFSIQADDQTWPGGLGLGQWELLASDDPRITDADRERLGWILDEASQ